MSKLLFKKGTQLYIIENNLLRRGTILIPASEVKLEADYETELPEKDYTSTIMGTQEIPVTEDTSIHYKDEYYLKAGDASNFITGIINEKAKNAISKIADFFYEEEPAKKHLEEDENGNMIEVEDEPKRSINWFKVGACSTSVTLMLIGAIIMIIKKHH